MKYILDSKYALRSWRLIPFAYSTKNSPCVSGLKPDEFSLLKKCDGQTDLPETGLLASLVEKGLVHPCEGENLTLTDWQRPMTCSNRCFPIMNWAITDRCNFNCRHCFNAVDNAPQISEWSMDDAERLMDEARDCGVSAVSLTGGEPLMHSRFMEIVEGIYRRGMYVNKLYTNGCLITADMLCRLKALGCRPLITISFDGIGYHDWMRGHADAEKKTLDAIKLCIKEGFPVMVHTNVNRVNLAAIPETLDLLEKLGVKTTRLIRTTESPRWAENANGGTLSLPEYYDEMAYLVHNYIKSDRRMNLSVWQYITIYPKTREYSLIPVKSDAASYRDSEPVCQLNRTTIAVAANGHVFPCHQMSGYYEQHGLVLGDVKKGSLCAVLQDSPYLCDVCRKISEVRAHDPKCAACSYFTYCHGGCRAIAQLMTGDKLSADPSKCLFFKGGYYEKITAAMGDYQNLSPVQANA